MSNHRTERVAPDGVDIVARGLTATRGGEYKMDGSRASFTVRYGYRRTPWLLVELESLSGPVSPRLFLPRSLGFVERHSRRLPPAERHVVLLNVRPRGTLRSFRIEPNADAGTNADANGGADRAAVRGDETGPDGGGGRFRLTITAFDDRNEAAAACLDLVPARAGGVGSGTAQTKDGAATRSVDRPKASLLLIRRLPMHDLTPRNLIQAFKRTPKARYKHFYKRANRLLPPLGARASDPSDGGPGAPWLSIVVPVHDANPRHLTQLLRSVEAQGPRDGDGARGVELILSDDGSKAAGTLRWLEEHADHPGLAIERSRTNGGIAVATRAGLACASAQWVAFMDHDDVLAPHALRAVAAALREHPSCRFLYTDEVAVDDDLVPVALMGKPAFDPVLLRGVNFVNHLTVCRRDLLARSGGMREGLDGSQDFDVVLRATAGLRHDEIVHLPYPAYWWRQIGDSYSQRYIKRATRHAREAIARAETVRLEDALPKARLIAVKDAITPTLHKPVVEPDQWPMISVIIPSRNARHLIETVLTGVLEKTDYPNLEVLVIDNGSDDPTVLALYERLEADPRFRVEIRERPFNFSAAVNRGVELMAGEHALLLNNDIEIVEPDWLREMVSCLWLGDGRAPVGIVGAKLLYPDGTIQHAGVVTGVSGLAVHRHGGEPADTPGALGSLHVRGSVTCVTGAAMLLSRGTLDRLGPWDEENFAVAFNDIDYCLRLYRAGGRCVWTPFASLIHHESISRGSDTTPANRRRFEREKDALRSIHGTNAFVDPAMSALAPVLNGPLKALPAPRTWFGAASGNAHRHKDDRHDDGARAGSIN